MKKNRIFFVAIISILFIAVESCQKQAAFKEETGDVSDDLSNIQSGMDAALNDANIAMSNFGKSASVANISSICGATVDTNQINAGIIKLNFDDSTVCNGRYRSGEVLLTLQNYSSGARWRDVGAVMDIEMINYKVENFARNKHIIFNGSKTVTNVSGGNAAFLIFGQINSLIHNVNGNNIVAKFQDGTTSTFNISRQYTHTFSNQVYEVKGEGLSTQNGLAKIEKWGTTRGGSPFTSQVVKPVIWNNICGANKPISGELDINVDAKDFNFYTTFGVDANGNVVNSGCPWGFKVEWKLNNKTGKKLFQYN
jgi:hypothetical protein